MLPNEELLESIDIIAQNAAKNGVKIYTAIVTAVADDNTCTIRTNGKTHSGIAYYGEAPSVNKSYRVFCPNGSMNQAFIITGGGSLPIASADTLGGIKVGAGLSITSQGTLSATGGGTADAVEWNNVLDKPSTISGYGITDAKISGNDIILGINTMTPYTANNEPPYPVTSVNGQTGDVVIPTGGNVDSVNGKTGTVVLAASDVGALPDTTEIPSKTSQLENDSGYITSSALSGYAKTSDIPTKTSQLDNNSGFITADDIPVKSVDGATGDVVTNAVKTTAQNLTDTQKQQARTNIGAGTSSFDGDYNSLSNQPSIPTKTSDLDNDMGFITSADVPTELSELTNDVGYITESALKPYAKTTDLPTKTSQLTNDSGYITNVALDGYVKETDIPTKVSQLENDNKYITASGAPVQSVNGKIGVVQLEASDVGALPDSTVIPSKTSELTNDSGFITDIPIASATQLGGIKVGAGLSVTLGGVLSASGGGTADAVEWDNVLDKPTTIAGYGIIDAKIDNGTITLGDKTITPLTEAPVSSVNGKTGVVQLTADDVGALPSDTVIPTVNDATLTIRRNGTDVGSFTANSANDVNIDINVPTDKSDIGLGNVDNVKQYSASNPPPYPVTSVNGKIGDVTIDVSGGGTQVKIVRW